MSDFYMDKSEWNDDVRDEMRKLAQENNPGREIESETVTCPVAGVDDPDVLLFQITFVPEEPA